jgi:regulator of protease activity HflC (stomatin/prohibitin superfamily)
MTNICTVMVSMDLDELLSQRDTINTQILTVFDSATDPWSLKSPGLKLKIFPHPMI